MNRAVPRILPVILALLFFASSCGKYGPPVRPEPVDPEAAPTLSEENAEADSEEAFPAEDFDEGEESTP